MGEFRREGRGGGFNRSREGSRGGFGGGSRGGYGGGRDSGGRNGFSDRRPDLFDAVCAECGKDCRVPFRPTGDKPIFCSECFESVAPRRDDRESRDSRPPRRESSERPSFRDRERGFDKFMEKPQQDSTSASLAQFKEQLGSLSAKLDKILKIISPVITEVEISEIEDKKKSSTKKKETAKVAEEAIKPEKKAKVAKKAPAKKVVKEKKA
jgi:CxxC-x17-CxxC domain-containing protein